MDATKHRAIADENIEGSDDDHVDIEKDANDRAAEILLPTAEWRRSDAFINPSQKTIEALAEKIQVNPAVVAGRLRFERRNFLLFTKLVGYRKVRLHFPEVRWS